VRLFNVLFGEIAHLLGDFEWVLSHGFLLGVPDLKTGVSAGWAALLTLSVHV
jgi:hypothetical protein